MRSYMSSLLLVGLLLVGCGPAGSTPDAGPVLTGDGGPSVDAGEVIDGGPGEDGGADAGLTPDAGMPDAGLMLDAGMPDAGCTGTTLVEKLRCLPEVTFVLAVDAGLPGYERFNVSFRQPRDHFDADAGTFTQRIMLLASTADRPVVLSTSGYSLSERLFETTQGYQATQISYEYRYFAASRPASVDWSTNTIRQGAEDAHRIVAAFKPLFPAKWLETGISKGGSAALAHRRFFPNDVDATLAYGTPYSSSRTDPRCAAFLPTVGGATLATCRTALANLQRAALMKSAEIQPLMPGTYGRLGKPLALEHAVVDFGFTYWMFVPPGDSRFGCARIPDAATASAQTISSFISGVIDGWDTFSDPALAFFQGYYVSTATELGGPAPYDSQLSPLATAPGTYVAGNPQYLPATGSFGYQPTPQSELTTWVATSAQRLILLYGELDPWSAQAYTPNPQGDTLVVQVPRGNHVSQIADLASADRAQVWNTLDRWLGAVSTAPRSATHQVRHVTSPSEWRELKP